MQVIHEPQPLPLPVIDLAHVPEIEREEAARRIAMTQVVTQRFNLETGPLLLGMIVRITDTEHVLVLTMHHIITDGWSLRHFLPGVGAVLRCIYIRGACGTWRTAATVYRFLGVAAPAAGRRISAWPSKKLIDAASEGYAPAAGAGRPAAHA